MSDYYRIHCLDCDEQDYESRSNHGHEGQAYAIKNRGLLINTQIINLWPLEITVTVHGCSIDLQFLQRHTDHELVSMSEYRNHWYDQEGLRHKGEA